MPARTSPGRLIRREFRRRLRPGYSRGMERAGAVAVRTQYRARPGRRVIVVTHLASLRGPVRGMVELPLRLFWSSPDRAFDLGDLFQRRWLYQTVLREASRPDDPTGYLAAGIPVGLWPRPRRPARVRQTRGGHPPAPPPPPGR